MSTIRKIQFNTYEGSASPTTATSINGNNICIFTQGGEKVKTKAKQPNSITKEIQSAQSQLFTKYNVSKYNKQAENLEKALRNSKVPNLPGVGSTIKMNIKSTVEDIQNILGSANEKLQNCKTEDEIKSTIKEIENELQQKKHSIKVLSQRGEKAKELDKVFGKIYSDPTKAKLAEKINIDKITSKLTEPVEEVNVGEIQNNDSLNDKEKTKAIDEKFDKALKDDEISNVVDSLIKYIKKGEKDNILDDYINDDNESEENKSKNTETKYQPNNFTNKNPFVLS